MNLSAAVQNRKSVIRRPCRPRSAARSDAGWAARQRFHLRQKAIAAPSALLLSVCPDGRQNPPLVNEPDPFS